MTAAASASTLVPALRRPEPELARVRPAAADAPGRFTAALDRVTGAATPGPEEVPGRSASEALVATALVQPILAQARAASTAVEPFAPGPAERRFGGLLDQHLADRIVHATHFPLVDELARRLAAPGAAAPTVRDAASLPMPGVTA